MEILNYKTRNINEVSNNRKSLEVELLDVDKFIKKNNLKEVTNPIYFVRNGVPTSDGLLSNEIFGITKDQRSNIFAWIDLGDWFLNPLVYKIWSRMDKRINECIYGTKKFIINSDGELEENEKGECGIAFLKKNIDKIKLKSTSSMKRDVNIQFIEQNKDKMFINKMIVIPAYYRDVNSDSGKIGVGEINKLYDSLIISVRALKDSVDYGFSLSYGTRGRIQQLILDIYEWLTQEPNLFKKKGIIRRAVMSKTTDYASRLVLSAPNLRVERLEDLMVDLDYSAVPLASLCTNLFPQITFWIRRFFENEFSGNNLYPYMDPKTKEIRYLKVKDPMIQFSDERIKHELDGFIKGFSNRFVPVTVETDEGITMNLKFKGRNVSPEELEKHPEKASSIVNRRLTWCDLIYMAAEECSKDKFVLITRFPMDSYFNQFPTGIRVSSTKDTEVVYINNKVYKHYPKIREEDIGSNTSSAFIDTLNICNLFLEAIGGDYDGDQTTAKVAYSIEANEELKKFKDSKKFFVDLGASNIRISSKEAIQSIYNLTLILSEDKNKIQKPKF